MVDLRVRNQRYLGFYIWREYKGKTFTGYAVGKNGTSCHTLIPRSGTTKWDIINFIEENQDVE